MTEAIRVIGGGVLRWWIGPMKRTGLPSFALGPAPIDLRHGARAFAISRMAVSGYAVVMHTLLWFASGRDRWLWVAVMALGHTLIVVPITNFLIRRAVLWTYLVDVVAMCTGVLIVGEPSLMPYWIPIVVASAVTFAGGREGLKAMAIAAAGIPLAYLLAPLSDSTALTVSEVRGYGLTTTALWVIVGFSYIYSVGASVNRTRAALEEAQAAQEAARRDADDNATLVRTVADAAPVGLALQNQSGKFVYVNSQLAEIMGLSLFEVAERGVADAIAPDLLPEMEAQVNRALADATPFTLDYRTRSGSYLRHLGTPVTGMDGIALISTVQDLTAERRAMRDLRRTSVALDLTSTAVAMWDRSGEIVMANRVFRDIWCGGADPVGRRLADVMGADARALRAPVLIESGTAIEQEVSLDDGRSVWMSFVLADLVDAETGAPLRTMAARDVSDIVRSRKQLEGLLASKDQFIASVSHELRTPLTAVVGLAAEMSRGSTLFDTAELEEMAGLIAEQSTEVASLVEDLLVAARAEAGVLSISAKPIDLGEHVTEAIRSTPFGTHAPAIPGGVIVDADPMRVRQIVRNLVTNSIRYGGPTVSMEVGMGRRVGYVEVCDDGPPIPEDHQAKMFEAYQRAHERVGTPDSVGLGLTVSRMLARMMGGDVTYRHDGARSRFRLSLPLDPGSATVRSDRDAMSARGLDQPSDRQPERHPHHRAAGLESTPR